MKIIIDTNVINDAIRRRCSDSNNCEGYETCIECSWWIGKNDYIEIDDKITTEQIIDWLESTRVMNKLTE